ncbi:hypothetical protein BVZ31_00465 [Alcaligenes faecalis]|uniref:hypothetical protein n=1 Tax=Alcaligenes faecalis TaxID=511 RepID=UPI000A2E3208|nr:hypothetical protein [Alcaligenes faecalis]OSZ45880.1 hypothetical protein BVZ30_02620 [Alcaligenes faecalis]OSZ52796.1 hypothetical protein BVZ31_00465 [Alcaligenes faecalis]OSZ54841.1 hypothetical protein BVZ32_03415 [Alcaligenes faecalis]
MRIFKRLLPAWLVYAASAVAIAAALVTAAQVADAIRNSPNASPWLKANADAVGRLAMFESSGQLDVYNGSCCTGILQMNKKNIRKYAETSPEDFKTWDLQSQVDAWSKLTTEAMQARAPKTLAGVGTFDGREVDGDMVLACVQLGIGNCQKMINSGSCNGFADINGTTICKMADRIRNGPPTGNNGDPVDDIIRPNPDQGGTYRPPVDPCIREGEGCLPLTESLEQGFASGSGVSMGNLRLIIFATSTAFVILILMSFITALFRNYSTGSIEKVELVSGVQKTIMIGMSFIVVMSLF